QPPNAFSANTRILPGTMSAGDRIYPLGDKRRTFITTPLLFNTGHVLNGEGLDGDIAGRLVFHHVPQRENDGWWSATREVRQVTLAGSPIRDKPPDPDLMNSA